MTYPAVDTQDSMKYAFKKIYWYNYHYFLNYKEFSYTDFIPVTAGQGRLSMDIQKNFVMNANAPDKALAWEFLKFLTSMAANTDVYIPGLPVKRDVYDRYLTDELNSAIEQMTKDAAISPAGDPGDAVLNAKKILDSYTNMPMIYQYTPYSDIIFSNLKLFYDGTLTAEQAAAELQNKITIALTE
jgi:ABC-type glycerol-3-phosphate transport system substrate-binding protein